MDLGNHEFLVFSALLLAGLAACIHYVLSFLAEERELTFEQVCNVWQVYCRENGLHHSIPREQFSVLLDGRWTLHDGIHRIALIHARTGAVAPLVSTSAEAYPSRSRVQSGQGLKAEPSPVRIREARIAKSLRTAANE